MELHLWRPRYHEGLWLERRGRGRPFFQPTVSSTRFIRTIPGRFPFQKYFPCRCWHLAKKAEFAVEEDLCETWSRGCCSVVVWRADSVRVSIVSGQRTVSSCEVFRFILTVYEFNGNSSMSCSTWNSLQPMDTHYLRSIARNPKPVPSTQVSRLSWLGRVRLWVGR